MKIQSVKKLDINKDSTAIKLKINGYCSIWIINFYNNDGSLEKVQKLFSTLRVEIPSSEWSQILILGDYNIAFNEKNIKFKILRSLAKDMLLKVVEPNTSTHLKGKKLDYLIHGNMVDIKAQETLETLSDHKALLWRCRITLPLKKPMQSVIDRCRSDELLTGIISKPNCLNSKVFLSELQKVRESVGLPLKQLKRPHCIPPQTELTNLLLNISDANHLSSTINKYWEKIWRKTEQDRFSCESKRAYTGLKKILKYNLFEKKDGTIVDSIKDDNGDIITDPSLINKALLKTLKEVQHDEKWGHIEQKPFPKLSRLNEEEMEDIVSRLSCGKALAYDGVTDSLFRRERTLVTQAEINKPPPFLYKHTIKKLRDLWRIELDTFLKPEDTWGARLLALNKVSPNAPNRKQFRPIMIQSPLIKLLEARFLPKLQKYMNEGLVKSQTGFVPGTGIQVNLQRTLQRITMRTNGPKHKKFTYGLFIDFSNAFNSVPHTLLFRKLRAKGILEEEEIEFLEQLYSRYVIRIGDESFKANCGVAQGSVISPALFNIFIEDLAYELQDKAKIHLDDIMMYADDILTLCTSINQLKDAIQIIEDWCNRNGMFLNKSKSGIVCFSPRHAVNIPLMKLQKTKEKRLKKYKTKGQATKTELDIVHSEWVPAVKDISGIPVCSKYKYLGTYLTPKLTCKPQLVQIKRKAAFLQTKFAPYLNIASAEGRKDIFLTFIMPLFNPVLVLLNFEPSSVEKEVLNRLRRNLFKNMLGLSKRTGSKLVMEMIGKELDDVAKEVSSSNSAKWNKRKGNEEQNMQREPTLNTLRGIPNSWVKLINSQYKRCPLCKENDKYSSANRWHLKYKHNISLPNVLRIWRSEILPLVTDKNLSKEEINKLISPLITERLLEFERTTEPRIDLKAI